MGPRPWKPAAELKGALKRGDLRFAMTLAKEVAEDRHGRPIDLETALHFLPLIARESPSQYDAWACRWLLRWLSESARPTVDQAAEVAGLLAELAAEPSVWPVLVEQAGRNARQS